MDTLLFLGIGGAGMRGLAYLAEQEGIPVIGYDDNSAVSPLTQEQALEQLSKTTSVIYTDAAPQDHPIRVKARELGIPETPYHKLLGHVANKYEVLAVTGTHGKSSTTAFLAHILIEAGLDPMVLVGASMPTLPGKHARFGKGKYFVVEADEYRNHFYELSPSNIIITSIDFDHPDSFSGIDEVEQSYQHFIGQLRSGGNVFVPEQEAVEHPAITWPSATIRVSASDSEGITVPLPGNHMRQNASLAVALAEQLGVPRKDAIAYLKTFPGLARRFEILGTINHVSVRSDYGHHPTEIRATIEAAREVTPNTPIIALFEAHMPQRLHTFFDDFASALANADEVIVTKPFVPAGRDQEILTDAYSLAEKIIAQGGTATCIFDDTELVSELEKKPLSIAIAFSAGTLDNRLRNIVKNH